MPNTNRSWYLVYTKPQSEQKAKVHLEEQGFETYLPLFRTRKTRKKNSDAVKPLFPGYLFLFLDEQEDNWAPIRSTPGVSRLVRFGTMPAKVPGVLVQNLKSNENELGLQEIISPAFKEGDKIVVVDGPMEGLEAIFKTTKGSERVLILLNLIGKLTQVELEATQISPTD
jgi:transcriptional antiterminator RfaH